MKAQILQIGTVQRRPDGGWVIQGWVMQGGDYPAIDYATGRLGGWTPEELEQIIFQPK